MRQDTKNLLRTLVGILICASVGCATITEVINENQATNSDLPVTSFPDPLTGTRWELVSFADSETSPNIHEELRFFVKFFEGTIRFQGGCNTVYGYYHLSNDQITTSFRERTLVDCSDNILGKEKMEVEIAFYNAMDTFSNFILNESEHELRIVYVDGELLLRLSQE